LAADSKKETIEKRIIGSWTYSGRNFTWNFSKSGEYQYQRPDGRLMLHSSGTYRINNEGNLVITSESVTEPGSTTGERLGKMFGLGEQFLEWLSYKSFALIATREDGKPLKGPDGRPTTVGPFTKNE
jgi:hypothetical protein